MSKSETNLKSDSSSNLNASKQKYPTPDFGDNNKYKSGSFGHKVVTFLGKLSASIMAVVALMPIPGLCLGIGATLITHSTSASSLHMFGTIIQSIGNMLFSNLGLFFGVAAAMSFAKNKSGYAAFCGLITYFMFSYFQSGFITQNGDTTWNILWWKRIPNASVSEVFVGANALQTSVFGGLLAGLLASWTYNRFRTQRLPDYLAFFSGERAASLLCIFAGILLAIPFLIIWPPINIGLFKFGNWSSKLPAGLDSFIFGYIERALIPFGLHHAFYAPLWWSAAGGSIAGNDHIWLTNSFYNDLPNSVKENWQNGGTLADYLKASGSSYNPSDWAGDQKIWLSLEQYNLPFDWARGGFPGGGSGLNSNFIVDPTGHTVFINPGRFLQGKYPFMCIGYTFGAGLAIIFAAKKGEQRKIAMATMIPSIVTFWLTGVSEVLDFTFVFLAPALYWGVNCVLAGFSFMLMNVLGAHVGMTFSGGIIDLIIYGALPVRLGTNFWWVFAIGIPLFFIYFTTFYFYIKKFDIPTPGRGGATTLIGQGKKAEIREKLYGGGKEENLPQIIVECLGGRKNIRVVDSCATRLRVTVVNSRSIDVERLKTEGGALGCSIVGEQVQVIYGPKASRIMVNVQDYLAKI